MDKEKIISLWEQGKTVAEIFVMLQEKVGISDIENAIKEKYGNRSKKH